MIENDSTPEPENDELLAQDVDSAAEAADESAAEAVDEPIASPESDDLEAEAVGAADVISAETMPPAMGDDWMIGDIDAALAAVASFNEMMPEGEAEAEAQADAARTAPAFVPEMQLPPLTTLKRGQLGSVVPALLLIGIGAWLMLLTTTGTQLDPLLLALVIGGGIVLSLLAQWIGTGRWSRGVLFFALAALLLTGAVAGINAFAQQSGGIDLVQGYPLLIAALGLAFVLDGILARPASARVITPGLLLIVAGGVGLAVTLNLLPTSLLDFAAPLLPVVLVIVAVLLLLPLIFRRRNAD